MTPSFNKSLHIPGIGELSDEQLKKTINDLLNQQREILLISPQFAQLSKFQLEKIRGNEVQNLYRITGLATQ